MSGGKKQTARGASKRSKTQSRPQGAGPTTAVFDMRGQKVAKQINVAGNYVDQRGAGSADESEWNTEVIRSLLNAAFSDEEVTTLCFDRFREVYEEFASGMSKGQKIQRLLDYCERQDQIEKLLAQVQQRNPNQYARYEAQLRK